MPQSWAVYGGYLAAPRLSHEVRVKAQPSYKFRQFCRMETTFGAHMGQTLYFDKVSNVASAGRVISENEVVPTTSITIYQDTISVYEYSNSIEWTGWLDQLAELDINHIITNALMDDMSKTLDYAAGLAFLGADIVYTPTGTNYNPSYSVVTNGTPTQTTTRPCNTYDVKNIADMMKSTYLMPYYSGNEYICVATTSFLRGLRDDPDWINAKLYGAPQDLFSGEVGMYYGIRMIEENHILQDLTGGGGEAVFIAFDPVIEMDIYPEEIQAKVPEDYGRDRGVRWVWGGGFKKTWNYATEGEARMILVSEA